MATVEVDGKKYKVTDSLGYQGGYQAKYVMDGNKERVVVMDGGVWRFWTARDRLGSR